MILKKGILPILAALFVSVLPALGRDGADNAYSPFSKFGIGTLNPIGTSHSAGMGWTGVASRDNRQLNIINPAAVTARDTLAFMGDFSVRQNNTYFNQQDYRGNVLSTANNTFNIGNFVMSFPIWRSSAMCIGICPFSSVGYDCAEIVKDPDIISQTGNITDYYTGAGSIYQLYFGAGATFWKRLSVGAQFLYYWGDLEKFSERAFTSSLYRSIYTGSKMDLRGFSGKFGIQYEQPLRKDKLIVGATYRLPTSLNGDSYELQTATQSSVIDTLSFSAINLDRVRIPDEFSLGISYRRADRWSVEFDYTISDWRGSKSFMGDIQGFSSLNFNTSLMQSFNLGFEYVPNRNDIRYYMKRCSYRMGAYYRDEYYTYKGHRISTAGITLGMTFPIYRWYNGLTIGIDFGQRGTLKGATADYSPIRERFVNFSVSFNIFDIWFIKPKYE